jgi:hypothetical protein
MPRARLVCFVAVAMLACGCDQLGIEGAGAGAARREAEGKAIGGACRHAARSIEQCYAANRRADKAAVFAGWREMNDYMRENKMEAMPAAEAASVAATDAGDGDVPADGAPAKKPGIAGTAKSGGTEAAKPKPAKAPPAKVPA